MNAFVIVITGGSSGLGREIIRKVSSERPDSMTSVINLDVLEEGSSLAWNMKCDITKFADVEVCANRIGKVDILINNAGVNYINWIENIKESSWDKIMDTNAKGIFNTTKAFMPHLLKSEGTILNIVSNASHVPMTNSIAYNASKGAAAIMTLQMARELGPKGITVFGISPNKLANTKMSEYIDNAVCDLRGWDPEEARKYQLSSLPAGEETSPVVLAEFIDYILSEKYRHKYMAGTIIPYGK